VIDSSHAAQQKSVSSSWRLSGASIGIIPMSYPYHVNASSVWKPLLLSPSPANGLTNPVALPHHSESYLQHPSDDKRLDDHGQAEHRDHRR
jgi:hypothetical protein